MNVITPPEMEYVPPVTAREVTALPLPSTNVAEPPEGIETVVLCVVPAAAEEVLGEAAGGATTVGT